jgi:predicted amidohydrolase YtcJ
MTKIPDTSHRLTITNAEVAGQLVDVEIADGLVAAVTPASARSTLRPAVADTTIDADGGALIPGLHDHHTHILAFAASRSSLQCGPQSAGDVSQLKNQLRQAASNRKSGEWLRGVGYHESTAGPLDRFVLDTLVVDRPVRLQHRSGHAWFLNTAALVALGIDPLSAQNNLPDGFQSDAHGLPTGVLFGADDWLGTRVPRIPLDLAGAGAELASYGITGLTDATPTTTHDDLTLLASTQSNGDLPQSIMVMGGIDLAPDCAPGLLRGPIKLVLADHGLPNLYELIASLRSCRQTGRPVAMHCVTRLSLVLALAAWEEVGAQPGDRIEHGAIIPLELIMKIGELGLTVITQPGFIADRGDDYLADVDTHDQPHLWRCGSLIKAGISVGGSTDAPFGPPDPWVAIATAIHRQTPGRQILGARERISPQTALSLFLTTPTDPGGASRRIIAGSKANLCLLDSPLTELLTDPSSAHVRSTIIRGQPVTSATTKGDA